MRGRSASTLLYLTLGVLVIAAVVLVAGRERSFVPGRLGRAGGTTTEPVPPRVSVPATLLPDGTVPWVNEPAAESEVQAPPPVRQPVDPDAKPCAAAQLSATLPRCRTNIHRDDAGKEIANAGLLGFVEARNTSDRTCSLQGETPAERCATTRSGRQVLDLDLPNGGGHLPAHVLA